MGCLLIPEVLSGTGMVLAAWVYMHPLQKREPVERRMALSFAAMFAGVFLLEWFLGDGFLEMALRQAGYLLLLTFAIHYCVPLRKSASVYVAIWALVTSQFVCSVWIAVQSIFRAQLAAEWKQNLLLLFLYTAIYVLVYFTVAKKMPRAGVYDIGPRQMGSAVLFLVMMEFLTFMLLYARDRESWNMYYITIILAEFYCLSMLYVQTELFKKSVLEKELLTMNLLWQQQKDQYRLTRENIDLINRKCHDLKHQVKALRHMGDDDNKERYLRELEQSVQIYDAIVKTGNEVLDTILTEKSLYCEEQGIKISCVVDGNSLNFMDPVDLYAILGNALDNAIEEVGKIKDRKKRLIDVAVFTREKFLVIHISNPVEGDVQFKGGLPVTTKSDKGYHGFGLRSIRHNVQQYGGYMNVSVKNQSFILKMIIPLPN